ncbi:hypothetical protein F5Y16DRAFT_354591 [Xylariaceae sp. FL0255]|nr:hypothetical protein F5Y16DRAFT_354591 [Xylariaceae sp. FL0255]
MATEFVPYWKPLGSSMGPNSWVFFAVARIAGRHRPLAVISSVGDDIEPAESLQGHPLTACCQRITTIFSDAENHTAVRAELALASLYYSEGKVAEPPVELPEFLRGQTPSPRRWRPWDHDRMHEFPFITACLLQSVAFDAQRSRTCPALIEPLGTVYRDSSLEWGMVVIDITDLHAVRYGIVGFPVCEAKFVSSPQDEAPRVYNGYPQRGQLRLVDGEHLRQAMSASDYMTRFNYEIPILANSIQFLSQVPLVGTDAMEHFWPSSSKYGEGFTRPKTRDYELQSQPLIDLIQTVTDMDSPDKSILDKIQTFPRQVLQRVLIQFSGRFSGTSTEGLLIRLAFAKRDHISLDQFTGIPTSCISSALEGPDADQITAISICLDTVDSTLTELVEVLSTVPRLRRIVFSQSPDRKNDGASIAVFERLIYRSRMLSGIDITLTGAYSAALRKRPWLPVIANDHTVQFAPLWVFPIQQILVRHPRYSPHDPKKFDYEAVHLGDALLKPEKFAAGFLIYLATLLPSDDDIFDPKARLFSFSSSPALISSDLHTSAQVSPIPSESFAMPTWDSDDETPVSPQVRDLVPEGWTIIISREIHRDVVRSNTSNRQQDSYSTRYAFIRPRWHRIRVDSPTSQPLDSENLEIIGLHEFLRRTVPKTDPSIIDLRLHEVAETLANAPYTNCGTLPPGIDPLLTLTQSEALELLSDLLINARKLNAQLKETMQQNLESSS